MVFFSSTTLYALHIYNLVSFLCFRCIHQKKTFFFDFCQILNTTWAFCLVFVAGLAANAFVNRVGSFKKVCFECCKMAFGEAIGKKQFNFPWVSISRSAESHAQSILMECKNIRFWRTSLPGFFAFSAYEAYFVLAHRFSKEKQLFRGIQD